MMRPRLRITLPSQAMAQNSKTFFNFEIMTELASQAGRGINNAMTQPKIVTTEKEA